MTAHFIGGCAIGDSPETGVIDPYHRVYGHPGLHVVDGSAISANLGVNPSLTITAQAERAMSLWPNKGEADPRLRSAPPTSGSPRSRRAPPSCRHTRPLPSASPGSTSETAPPPRQTAKDPPPSGAASDKARTGLDPTEQVGVGATAEANPARQKVFLKNWTSSFGSRTAVGDQDPLHSAKGLTRAGT